MARRVTSATVKGKPGSPAPDGKWLQDRIREFRRVPPSTLVPHPKNWRRHPPDQQTAMQGLLYRLGYVNALLTRELEDGSLQVIDGHMRLDLSAEADHVPVLVLDVTEDEAELILATHDAVTNMALAEQNLADELARDNWTEDAAINTVLRDLLMNSISDDDSSKKAFVDFNHPLAQQPFEHYDYVVVLARTTIDFTRLCESLGIENKADHSVPGGARKIGLGRCIDAAKVIDILDGSSVRSAS